MSRRPRLVAKVRPIYRGRRRRRPLNPIEDQLACFKRPLHALNGPAPGYPILEFEPIDVREIRRQFHATQRVFAMMLGINVETLRNWEQGRRSPQGPARALLRIAASNPEDVVRVLRSGRRRPCD